MDEGRVRELVLQLDTTDFRQINLAWEQLRVLGEAAVPFFAEAYPGMKHWQGRATLLYTCTGLARTSQQAFELGILALSDRAAVVRHRACQVLAYSLNAAAIPHLEQALSHPDGKMVDDARAAIDAIKHQNHHYFMDRGHTGRLRWEVVSPEALGDPEYVRALLERHASSSSDAEPSDGLQPPDNPPGKRGGAGRGCVLLLLALGVAGLGTWLGAAGWAG